MQHGRRVVFVLFSPVNAYSRNDDIWKKIARLAEFFRFTELYGLGIAIRVERATRSSSSRDNGDDNVADYDFDILLSVPSMEFEMEGKERNRGTI